MIFNFISTAITIITTGITGGLYILFHRIREFITYYGYGPIYFLIKTAFVVIGFFPLLAVAILEFGIRLFVVIVLGLIQLLVGWLPIVGSVLRAFNRMVYSLVNTVFNLIHKIFTLPDIIF